MIKIEIIQNKNNVPLEDIRQKLKQILKNNFDEDSFIVNNIEMGILLVRLQKLSYQLQGVIFDVKNVITAKVFDGKVEFVKLSHKTYLTYSRDVLLNLMSKIKWAMKRSEARDKVLKLIEDELPDVLERDNDNFSFTYLKELIRQKKESPHHDFVQHIIDFPEWILSGEFTPAGTGNFFEDTSKIALCNHLDNTLLIHTLWLDRYSPMYPNYPKNKIIATVKPNITKQQIQSAINDFEQGLYGQFMFDGSFRLIKGLDIDNDTMTYDDGFYVQTCSKYLGIVWKLDEDMAERNIFQEDKENKE